MKNLWLSILLSTMVVDFSAAESKSVDDFRVAAAKANAVFTIPDWEQTPQAVESAMKEAIEAGQRAALVSVQEESFLHLRDQSLPFLVVGERVGGHGGEAPCDLVTAGAAEYRALAVRLPDSRSNTFFISLSSFSSSKGGTLGTLISC